MYTKRKSNRYFHLYGVSESALREEFDELYYLSRYPDVAAAGFDALKHFMSHGWREERDPSAKFSVKFYLDSDPPLRAAGVNPFIHYIKHGRAENRATISPELLHREKARSEFDPQYYLYRYPELETTENDLFSHYMSRGWREGRDPSSDFSTSYYLKTNPDIAESNIHPFEHYVNYGKLEGRRGSTPTHTLRRPSEVRVSAIVPNFNHAQYLERRLTSIFAQSHLPFEVIILDDASTDESDSVIKKNLDRAPCRISYIRNDTNSGNVFRQWQKGIAEASGDVIWICESDDFCDLEFLRNLVWMFNDPSVRIAFGRVLFADGKGVIIPGLDESREEAQPEIWSMARIFSASYWFSNAFGVKNIISNVGGCLIKREAIPEAVWPQASQFNTLGDWYIYLQAAAGGSIGFCPDAIAFFRQHGNNTSVKAFNDPLFYKEHQALHTCVRKKWPVSDETTFRFYSNVKKVFEASGLPSTYRLRDLISFDELLGISRSEKHIVISFLSFEVGGGEVFPIHLANEIYSRGYTVSACVSSMKSDNDFLRSKLNPGIPVYSMEYYGEMAQQFLDYCAADVLHSHNIWSEFAFLRHDQPPRPQLRYIVTLHGSYEVADLSDYDLLRFLRGVSQWVYTADRNLDVFRRLHIDMRIFTKIKNGLAITRGASPASRSDLELPEDAFVFLFAARSHPDKGWSECVEAFRRFLKKSGRKAYLLMIGSGEEMEKAKTLALESDFVRFLGLRSDIDDLLQLSDCCVVPSRFAGESMPLIVIQSLLNGRPLIATDVGDIATMIVDKDIRCGILVQDNNDKTKFISQLSDAMEQVQDEALYADLKGNIEHFASEYSIVRCADDYLKIYELESVSAGSR